MNQELIGYLFKTKAIRVCPKDKPFWYTSGKIGPYYVNTHFLYGSEEKALGFLSEIDRLKEDKLACSLEFHGITLKNYNEDEIYRGTIDALISHVKKNMDEKEIQYVSGGERRDWFFSFMVAHILHKPHITIFKDLSTVVYENGKSAHAEDLSRAKVLHIADLITTASSYERAWVPALNQINGQMKQSLVVVDRLQGGSNVLSRLGVESHCLVSISEDTFKKAYENGYINNEQLDLVLKYMDDPDSSMKSFLKANPGFLEEALSQGGKTAERARLLIQNKYYE